MFDDSKFNYLKIYTVEWYLEVGLKCVIRNGFLSSDIWSSFKKNLNNALYVAWTDYNCRKIIQNGALFTTIQILTTFVGQNLQVFLWRDLEDNNLGNYLLGVKNIIPARIFPISLYFLRIEIAIFA